MARRPIYIVTGAAGFIGFHVSARLAREGADVLGIDNLNAYYDVALKHARLAELRRLPSFRFEQLDVTDDAGIRQHVLSAEPDAVIHLAAQAGVRYSIEQPKAYIAANVEGFLSVLEACRAASVPHLLYASSSSVYGLSGQIPFSEHADASHPVSLYGATKRANELMAHSYAHLFGLPCTGLRFFTVYGPWGRPDMAYFKFARAIQRGEPIDVYNEGRLERDFTYIDDAVDAVVKLAQRPLNSAAAFDPQRPDPAHSSAPYRIFNVGNQDPVTLDRFISALERALGRPAKRNLLPMQAGDMHRTCANTADLTAAVGYRAGTSIEEGMQRFVDWLRGYDVSAAKA